LFLFSFVSFLLSILFLLMQSTILKTISLNQITPDLYFLVFIFYSCNFNLTTSSIYGFMLGLILDLVSFLPLGFSSLIYVIMSRFISFLNIKFKISSNIFIMFFACLIFISIKILLYSIFKSIFLRNYIMTYKIFSFNFFLEVFLTSLLYPMIFSFLKFLKDKTINK